MNFWRNRRIPERILGWGYEAILEDISKEETSMNWGGREDKQSVRTHTQMSEVLQKMGGRGVEFWVTLFITILEEIHKTFSIEILRKLMEESLNIFKKKSLEEC